MRRQKTWTKNRACGKKKGFKTQAEAWSHLNKIVTELGAYRPSLVIYRCKQCKLLHVGHQSPALYSGRYKW